MRARTPACSRSSMCWPARSSRPRRAAGATPPSARRSRASSTPSSVKTCSTSCSVPSPRLSSPLGRWLPVVAWAGVIWTLSSGSFSGERTGTVILPLLSTLFPSATPGQLVVVHEDIRKLAHFVEYLILSVLLYRALDVEPRGSLRAGVLALCLAGLYAGSDELHQWFVPGRGARVSDWLLDVSGAAAGQGLPALRAPPIEQQPHGRRLSQQPPCHAHTRAVAPPRAAGRQRHDTWPRKIDCPRRLGYGTRPYAIHPLEHGRARPRRTRAGWLSAEHGERRLHRADPGGQARRRRRR